MPGRAHTLTFQKDYGGYALPDGRGLYPSAGGGKITVRGLTIVEGKGVVSLQPCGPQGRPSEAAAIEIPLSELRAVLEKLGEVNFRHQAETDAALRGDHEGRAEARLARAEAALQATGDVARALEAIDLVVVSHGAPLPNAPPVEAERGGQRRALIAKGAVFAPQATEPFRHALHALVEETDPGAYRVTYALKHVQRPDLAGEEWASVDVAGSGDLLRSLTTEALAINGPGRGPGHADAL